MTSHEAGAQSSSERRAIERERRAQRDARAQREARADRRENRERAQVQAAKPIVTQGPVISLVSLNDQRMYVYDANGYVTQTRISSGRPGHETPKGIYSILEKKVDHTSNIYLDAKMPHMQRLTMTGIALHGGIIPGYAASGGCVRLPFDFARRFFTVTDLNQRVVIAPDVHAPVAFEHELLMSALPSTARAAETGTKLGIDVAEAVLGISPAHAAAEPMMHTIESATEARRQERQALVDAIDKAAQRRTAAAEGEKTAAKAVGDARTAAKSARSEASKLARDASKLAGAAKAEERKLKTAQVRLDKGGNKLRGDQLEGLRTSITEGKARLADLTKAAEAAASDAERADKTADAAEKAVGEALTAVKVAKAEIKESALAEIAAKKAVVTFDRQEANRALPVSVFISSATGLVRVRQGFEEVLEAQATIENPDVPLDTFVFTAASWKDEKQASINWTATEVNENSTRFSSFEDAGAPKKQAENQSLPMPQVTDTEKARRTLDRIKIPREVSLKIAEVMKPGSTLIVSSYDTAKSEMRYAGTDFVVQMPEVVAKISRPTPRPQPVETYAETGGGWFFFGSPPPPPRVKRRIGSSRGVW